MKSAVSTYVDLHKEKFGEYFGKYIEQCLYSSLSNSSFTLPDEWNDMEFAKWAEYDLIWMATQEGGIQIVGSEYAESIFENNLEQFEEEDLM